MVDLSGERVVREMQAGYAAVRMVVVPEPDDDEATALWLAIATMEDDAESARDRSADATVSRWAMAGRRAAHQGMGKRLGDQNRRRG